MFIKSFIFSVINHSKMVGYMSAIPSNSNLSNTH